MFGLRGHGRAELDPAAVASSCWLVPLIDKALVVITVPSLVLDTDPGKCLCDHKLKIAAGNYRAAVQCPRIDNIRSCRIECEGVCFGRI